LTIQCSALDAVVVANLEESIIPDCQTITFVTDCPTAAYLQTAPCLNSRLNSSPRSPPSGVNNVVFDSVSQLPTVVDRRGFDRTYETNELRKSVGTRGCKGLQGVAFAPFSNGQVPYEPSYPLCSGLESNPKLRWRGGCPVHGSLSVRKHP
jgi:hypothetical protein